MSEHKYGKYGQIDSEAPKYFAELRAFCPFCEALRIAEVEAHLDFEDDYMENYPDWGPFYSLWVTITCKGCNREIYMREQE